MSQNRRVLFKPSPNQFSQQKFVEIILAIYITIWSMVRFVCGAAFSIGTGFVSQGLPVR